MISARRLLKDYGLLWSMLAGVILSPWAYRLSFILPYSLFLMLALSYTRIAPSDLKITRTHVYILLVQWLLGPLMYLFLAPYDELLAEGVALLILTPTATSAPVITGMIGGNMGFVTAILIPANILMAIAAPAFLSHLYPEIGGSYADTVFQMLGKVSVLLILPTIVIWILRFKAPSLHLQLQRRIGWTFYIWCINLAVITSNTIHFFIEHDTLTPRYGILLGGASLCTCLLLFGIGRTIGRKVDRVSINAGQTLGQKNTILAIWMALTFMNPLVSILPSFYVLWQNIFNSIELALYKRRQIESLVNPSSTSKNAE